MPRAVAVALALFVVASGGCVADSNWLPTGGVALVEVATSPERWTGLAIAADGRMFVNFPRWSGPQAMAVGEIQSDGAARAYPNRAMNGWDPGVSVAEHLVCVQAVLVDERHQLWILDTGNPGIRTVIDGAPKLVVVDLAGDRVVRTIPFGPDVARPGSYLNDLRVDHEAGAVYLTDSGDGALVVVDLATGAARRVLDDHPSTQAEPIDVTVGGKPWRMGGAKPEVHADGIALSRDGRWLYYQALTGRTMYRIPTAVLRDTRRSEAEIGASVQRVAVSGVSDGLLYGPDDHVYISALEHDAIRRVGPDGRVETVITDERIAWPDTFALGPGSHLHFTTARIHEGGEPRRPFAIYRLEPAR